MMYLLPSHNGFSAQFPSSHIVPLPSFSLLKPLSFLFWYLEVCTSPPSFRSRLFSQFVGPLHDFPLTLLSIDLLSLYEVSKFLDVDAFSEGVSFFVSKASRSISLFPFSSSRFFYLFPCFLLCSHSHHLLPSQEFPPSYFLFGNPSSLLSVTSFPRISQFLLFCAQPALPSL